MIFYSRMYPKLLACWALLRPAGEAHSTPQALWRAPGEGWRERKRKGERKDKPAVYASTLPEFLDLHLRYITQSTHGLPKHVTYAFTVRSVSRHFGPRTLRTQDISALSDWCRTVSTSITHLSYSIR